jgi:hypothetical protein
VVEGVFLDPLVLLIYSMVFATEIRRSARVNLFFRIPTALDEELLIRLLVLMFSFFPIPGKLIEGVVHVADHSRKFVVPLDLVFE